ncbi:MAG: SemiSWEET transporter [Oscillatoriales cyanobacterium SM2_2_1]|nr:SemiSWEET transporter [Oscillatoriales cyanobacterium SM2_2_1]
MTLVDAIGYIAAMLTTAAFLPQVIKVWRSRSAKDLSLPALITFIIGVTLWLTYGLMVTEMPIIIANLVTLGLNLFLLRLKLRYS